MIYELNIYSLLEKSEKTIKFEEKTDKKAIEKGLKMYFNSKIISIFKTFNSSNKVIIYKNKDFKK